MIEFENFADFTDTEKKIIEIVKKYHPIDSFLNFNQFFLSEYNRDELGAATIISQEDLRLLSYFLFKYASGINRPSDDEIKDLSHLLSIYILKLTDKSYAQQALLKDGDLTTFHSYYLMHHFYSPF